MEENHVKNQHYISQGILKNFAYDNSHVYECLVDKERIYPTNYANSMSEKYIYEHSKIEINKLEKFFNRIENYICPAIIKFIKNLESENPNLKKIKSKIEYYMREFLIFYYRSGALLHEFSYNMKNKKDKVFLLLENILNSNYLETLKKVIINNYKFAILKSNNDFIMSDQYISTAALGIKGRFTNINNRYIGLKDVIIFIPLSSKFYAVYFNGNNPSYIKDNKINNLSKLEVEEINNTIINNSYVKAVGQKKNLLKKALSNYTYHSPIGSIAEFKSGKVSNATVKKEVFFYNKDKEIFDFFTSHKWIEYKNLGRNDKCLCGSGEKFKRCCLDKYDTVKSIINNMQMRNHRNEIVVNKNAMFEKSIGEFIYYK